MDFEQRKTECKKKVEAALAEFQCGLDSFTILRNNTAPQVVVDLIDIAPKVEEKPTEPIAGEVVEPAK